MAWIYVAGDCAWRDEEGYFWLLIDDDNVADTASTYGRERWSTTPRSPDGFRPDDLVAKRPRSSC
jgi:hypothetical protein